MNERKIYPILDIAKFIMAILILMQHTCNEWAHSTGLLHYFWGLGNFAVPFFFACSGFLFFSKLSLLNVKEKKIYYKQWSMRIGKMYLVWSFVYFIFVFYNWWQNGFILEKIISYIHRALVFSTFSTIWFLPALWLGVSICCLLTKYFSTRIAFIIVMVLLIIGNIFGSYSHVVLYYLPIESFYDLYMDVFITWRNGIFNGAPYVFLGTLIAKGVGCKLSFNSSVMLAFFFCVLFCLEAFLIVKNNYSNMTDMGFIMFPATYFVLLALVKCKWGIKKNFIHFRNLSMLIFLDQRLFLTAIPMVLSEDVKVALKTCPEPIIYLLFFSVVLGFSLFVESQSKKYKCLKNLW